MKFKIELDTSRLDLRIVLKIIVGLILAIILIYFKVDLVNVIIAFYFLMTIFFSVESRYSFYLALFFLVLTAFLSTIGKNSVAENYAVYAFYFLAIGTITALIEVARKRT